MPLSRRALLARAARVLPVPALVGAAGPSDLRIGQLKTRDVYNPRPTALRRLLWEVRQRTSIEVDLEPALLRPGEDVLFRYPFLYWAGLGPVSEWTPEERRRVRRHITYGGTLLVDAAGADPGGAFDRGVRAELSRILPRHQVEKIPNDHVLYKSFYLVDHQAGRTLRVPYLEAVTIEGRYAVIYCQNDLGGAWARDAFGRWEYEVSPGGARQREMAFRLGINIVMYALCLDYKDDLVHSPFILKRRR